MYQGRTTPSHIMVRLSHCHQADNWILEHHHITVRYITCVRDTKRLEIEKVEEDVGMRGDGVCPKCSRVWIPGLFAEEELQLLARACRPLQVTWLPTCHVADGLDYFCSAVAGLVSEIKIAAPPETIFRS